MCCNIIIIIIIIIILLLLSPVFNTCVEHVLNSRLDSSQTQILGYVFVKDERKIEHVFKMC